MKLWRVHYGEWIYGGEKYEGSVGSSCLTMPLLEKCVMIIRAVSMSGLLSFNNVGSEVKVFLWKNTVRVKHKKGRIIKVHVRERKNDE